VDRKVAPLQEADLAAVEDSDNMNWKYIKEDVRRRSGKFLFLIISVAIGVAAFTGILTINISAQEDIDRQLESFGANMVVYPDSEDFSLQYGGVSLTSVDVKQTEINEEDVEKIMMIPNAENINVLSPKVVGVTSGERTFVIVGVDFDAELKLKEWWEIHGEIPGEGEILLGSGVYEKLNLANGDELELNGQNFIISGYINKTDTQDDNVIFMNLHEAQKILGKEGKISLIEVMAFCNTCPIEEIIRQIEETVPNVKGVAARQLINAQMSLTARFLNFGLAVSLFILIVGVVSLTATMMSFVKEKTKEIGILRAVGFRKRDIGRIVTIEMLLVSLIASVFGYFLGQMVAIIMGGIMLNIPVVFNFAMLGWAFAISIMVCSVATLLPLRTASKITVIEALRSL
jgi:putative ABC transport system permease protein